MADTQPQSILSPDTVEKPGIKAKILSYYSANPKVFVGVIVLLIIIVIFVLYKKGKFNIPNKLEGLKKNTKASNTTKSKDNNTTEDAPDDTIEQVKSLAKSIKAAQDGAQ